MRFGKKKKKLLDQIKDKGKKEKEKKKKVKRGGEWNMGEM